MVDEGGVNDRGSHDSTEVGVGEEVLSWLRKLRVGEFNLIETHMVRKKIQPEELRQR